MDLNCINCHIPKNKIRKTIYHDISFICIVIIYRILLDYIYIHITSILNAYDGFILNIGDLFTSWTILFVELALVLPLLKKGERLSTYFIVIIFCLKFIPFTSFIYCCSPSINLIIFESLYSLFILILFNILPGIKLPKFRENRVIISFISLIFIIAIIYISAKFTNFRIHLTLSDVYDLRDEARGYRMPTFLTYLFSNAVKVLPILMIFYYEKKNYFVASIILLCLILAFSIDGLKSTFLNIFICLILFIIKPKTILTKLYYVFFFLCVFAIIEWLTINTPFIEELFLRRLLYMPNLLDNYYFKYETINGPTFFNNVLNGTDVSFLIGAEWRTIATRANNGLFSDAFLNLGILGIIIYPLLYAIFIKIIDLYYNKRPVWLTFYAAFIISYNMLSSFFTVCLFTHGVLVILIIGMFLPNRAKLKS